jgi:hypothetical protein
MVRQPGAIRRQRKTQNKRDKHNPHVVKEGNPPPTGGLSTFLPRSKGFMVGEDPLCSSEPGQRFHTTGLNDTFSTIAAVGIIGKL